MNNRSEISLRIMAMADTAARRVVLADLAARAMSGHAAIISETQISLERFAATESDILIADLESATAAASMIDFLENAPQGAGSVALIDEPDQIWVRSALGAGINAILGRDADPNDLQLAVQAAEAGFVLLHPTSVRGLIMDSLAPEMNDDGMTEELTMRESEVLRLVSMGLGNKEVAVRLAISEHTVKFHISSVLGKLHATSRTEAVSLGIRKGLIPI
jgi:DNA-binding NarL/FixJ family response regulator